MYFIIYETTNQINGMKYRGCHSTENINDGYLGSGSYFKKAVKKYGKENFTREILYYCKNISDMIEKESEYVDIEWIYRHDTYNLQTGGLSYGILSEESKKKISQSVSLAHQEGKFDYTILKGKAPWNKDQKEIYSEESKKKMREAKKDYIPWNSGKIGVQEAWNKGLSMGHRSEEDKNKISVALKKKYEMQDHHLKGKTAHNKGKKTGKPSWNSGIILEKNIECPHCNTVGGSAANMKRWHFDNCKHK